MTISIKKVMLTEMNIHQVHLYFNMHVLKSAYFGCRVIQLSLKQQDELKIIYKGPIMKKLGQSMKFPKYILYARKLVSEVGLL